jgi:hypothetical protein
MSQTVVVLDSSALIAQINGKDIWHKKADAITAFIAQTGLHTTLVQKLSLTYYTHNPLSIKASLAGEKS